MNFVYNEKEKEYETSIEVLNKKVNVVAKEEPDIEVATKVINNLDINNLINFIVKEYYDKNDNTWFGSEVSQEEFINSLFLKTISVRYGYITYWFDAGNLYGDHNITLSKKYDESELTIDLA